MADFFEDLGKRLSETAEAVTAKAGDAIEIQKLKAQIRELARGNAEDLMELGQSIYDRFENGEELDEASKGLCEAIASRKESMEEYENKIEGLKVRVSVHGVVRWLRKIWLSAHTADHL